MFYWRSHIQNAGQGTRIQTGSYAGCAGPARVLALATRRDGDGRVRPSSVAWLVRNNRLIKASTEQLRFASEREKVLHEFEKPTPVPWTLSEITGPSDNETFDDISAEVPSQREREEAGEGRAFRPTPRHRVMAKRPLEPVSEETTVEGATSAPSGVPRPRSRSPHRREEANFGDEGHCFWQSEVAAVAIEVKMPTSRSGWHSATQNLEAYLVSALKKKSVEVYERRMDEDTKKKFRVAKDAEVKKFIVSEALQALPKHLQPPPETAMRMRWLLTWKSDADGNATPKARAVILGYQDPQYEFRVTYAPTTTRHTRQLMLQYASCRKWHAWKGDVAAAFLQGREIPHDLFCIPTEELCSAMQVPRESCGEAPESLLWFGSGPLPVVRDG